MTSTLLLCGCKMEKKYVRYETLYSEQPQKIYTLLVSDYSERKETADSALLALYSRQDIAADHVFTSQCQILKAKGYNVVGSEASNQIKEIDKMPKREILAGDLSSIRKHHGIDALLITTLHKWSDNKLTTTAYLEYQIRSTHSGKDLAHFYTKVSRTIDTTYKGKLIALMKERELADTLHIDLEGGIRCYMLQQATMLILQDLPYPASNYYFQRDMYLPAINEYLKITINNEGSAEVGKMSMEEFENDVYL